MLKILSKKLLRSFLHIFWVLPVNKKKIFFSSFKGSSITCNPYYIYKQLIEEDKNLEIIWCCNNPELHYLANDGNVSFVKFNSLGYIFSLITSRIIISNASLPTWIPFRHKKQILINTWHGGGAYKKVGADEFKTKAIIEREQQSAEDTTFFISSSKQFTEVMSHSTYVPLKKFLNIGMPRNDLFFDKVSCEKINQQTRKEIEIGESDLLVLYAPTYRGSSLNSSEYDSDLDIKSLKQCLMKKFNKPVKVIYRGHYFSTNNSSNQYDKNVSSYPLMQNLLCAADILITDYSSSIWDFALTGKLCLIFATDIQTYIKERGFYVAPGNWGFPIAQSNTELSDCITNFNIQKYSSDLNNMFAEFGSFETGQATKKIIKLIRDNIYECKATFKN